MDANGRFRFSIPSMWVGFHRFSRHISNVFDSMIWDYQLLPLVFCWASWGVVRISLRQLTFRPSSRGRGTELRFFWSYPLGCKYCMISQDIPRHCWLDVLYGASQTPGVRPVRIGVLWILSWRNRTDWKRITLTGEAGDRKVRDSVSLQQIDMRILNLEGFEDFSWNLMKKPPLCYDHQMAVVSECFKIC